MRLYVCVRVCVHAWESACVWMYVDSQCVCVRVRVCVFTCCVCEIKCRCVLQANSLCCSCVAAWLSCVAAWLSCVAARFVCAADRCCLLQANVVAVCCSVLQCVADRCRCMRVLLQCVAGDCCCRVLQGVAGCCRVLQGVAVCCSVLKCVAVCWSVLQGEAKARMDLDAIHTVRSWLCLALQHTATHCNTYCNTLQHNATQCNTQQQQSPATQRSNIRMVLDAMYTLRSWCLDWLDECVTLSDSNTVTNKSYIDTNATLSSWQNNTTRCVCDTHTLSRTSHALSRTSYTLSRTQ